MPLTSRYLLTFSSRTVSQLSPHIRDVAKTKRTRDRERVFVLEGTKPILELVRSALARSSVSLSLRRFSNASHRMMCRRLSQRLHRARARNISWPNCLMSKPRAVPSPLCINRPGIRLPSWRSQSVRSLRRHVAGSGEYRNDYPDSSGTRCERLMDGTPFCRCVQSKGCAGHGRHAVSTPIFLTPALRTCCLWDVRFWQPMSGPIRTASRSGRFSPFPLAPSWRSAVKVVACRMPSRTPPRCDLRSRSNQGRITQCRHGGPHRPVSFVGITDES